MVSWGGATADKRRGQQRRVGDGEKEEDTVKTYSQT
jgi:hypothetical protein